MSFVLVLFCLTYLTYKNIIFYMEAEDLFREWNDGAIVSIDKPLPPDEVSRITEELMLALVEAERQIDENGAKYGAKVTVERDEGNNPIKGRLEIFMPDGEEGEYFSVNRRPDKLALLTWFSPKGKPFINSTVAAMRARELLKKIAL